MKFAINTNSFRKQCTKAELVKLAVDAGVDGIEWGLGSLDDAAGDAAEMSQRTRDAGLAVCGFINAGILWKFDEIRRWSEAAAAAGAPNLRVAHPWFAWNYQESLHQRESFQSLLDRSRKGLEKLQDLSREYHLRYVLETHAGGVAASPWCVPVLLKDLDPATVGVIYDPANTCIEGFVRPAGAVNMMGPYMAYLHLKNLELVRHDPATPGLRPEWVPERRHLEAGMVDYMELAYALKLNRFDGWGSFEEPVAKTPAEALDEYRHNIEYIKNCLAQAPDKPEEPFLTFND